MSLSTAFNIAQSALLNNSRQTTTVSRNVAEKDNADYTRRVAVLSSQASGARIVDVQRATNQLLMRNSINATSSYQGQKTLLDGLRVPHGSMEGQLEDVNAPDPAPFFCLLEDDSLVTKVSVESEQLLRPAAADEVVAIISVHVKRTVLTPANLAL